MLSLRTMFTVASDPFSYDSTAPECGVTFDSFEDQCGNISEDAAQCAQGRWTARFNIKVSEALKILYCKLNHDSILKDTESGLRSISELPAVGYNDPVRFFSRDSFVVADDDPSAPAVEFLYSSSCCSPVIGLTVVDAAGNARACAAGDAAAAAEAGGAAGEEGSGSVSSTTLTIIIVVATLLLVLVIVAAAGAILYVKKKRKAELAEMRESPQAR